MEGVCGIAPSRGASAAVERASSCGRPASTWAPGDLPRGRCGCAPLRARASSENGLLKDLYAAQEHVAAEGDQPGEEPLHKDGSRQATAHADADIHAGEGRDKRKERRTRGFHAVLTVREK